MANNENSSSSSDESLDVGSKNFNPLKALYSQKIRFPVPEAPIYDNVQKYESVLKGIVRSSSGKKSSQTVNKNEEKYPRKKIFAHQAQVEATRHARAPGRNIMTKMQKTLGPLGMLYQYMERRIRVKVYTRNVSGIRGHVEAYVAAFDKHWNLALEDCFEVWSRKMKRKAPPLGTPIKNETLEGVPKATVIECNGKVETLERHVPQMLLRGEQIAIIVKIN